MLLYLEWQEKDPSPPLSSMCTSAPHWVWNQQEGSLRRIFKNFCLNSHIFQERVHLVTGRVYSPFKCGTPKCVSNPPETWPNGIYVSLRTKAEAPNGSLAPPCPAHVRKNVAFSSKMARFLHHDFTPRSWDVSWGPFRPYCLGSSDAIW